MSQRRSRWSDDDAKQHEFCTEGKSVVVEHALPEYSKEQMRVFDASVDVSFVCCRLGECTDEISKEQL